MFVSSGVLFINFLCVQLVSCLPVFLLFSQPLANACCLFHLPQLQALLPLVPSGTLSLGLSILHLFFSSPFNGSVFLFK